MDADKYLEELFLRGIESCSPFRMVEQAMELDGDTLRFDGQELEAGERPLYVLAVGKASVPMYRAASDILGSRIAGSLVITPKGKEHPGIDADEIIESSHPAPDVRSLSAGKSARNFFKNVPAEAIAITLISGGTSSLMCLPATGISLEDLNKTFELLNNSGATIRAMNTVRKHCSQIKGGQLLRYLDPEAALIDLVISDVPGDDLSIIGSGPTTEDSSTFGEARRILQKYGLEKSIPESVLDHIEKGISVDILETISPGKDPIWNHHSHIISSARRLSQKIAQLASGEGANCRVPEEAYNDDVETVAQKIIDRVLSSSEKDAPDSESELYIFYGESTVEVKGDGKGGRNQEMALRAAMKIRGQEQITLLSAGTDGVDGPTDAAGAIVDGNTIKQAMDAGLNPWEYLDDNDSYHFHEKMGTLLKTGPTGNNLMDLVMVFKDGQRI